MKRVHGILSLDMATVFSRRADALGKLDRLTQARAAALESMRITERVFGRGDNYARGLYSLAIICRMEGDFDVGLKHIREAHSLLSAERPDLLGAILNEEATLLMELERYQDALFVREKEKEFSLRFLGPNHPQYAVCLCNAAMLYAKLKQVPLAIDLVAKALAIHMDVFGPSHPFTQNVQDQLLDYRKALIDPKIKNQLASKSHRMCNIDGCHIVKEKMNRCLKCLSFYVCEKHKDKIDEHIVVCPKYPDVLPDEKKIDKIAKCRRCRKETKLMKCAVCGTVWYCGAQWHVP